MKSRLSIPLVLLLILTLSLPITMSNIAPSVRAQSDALTLLQSGYVYSDSLTTGNTAYWAFYGSAVGQNATTYHSEDSSGLTIGNTAVAPGVWAGYFAISPLTQAEVFHAFITMPNSSIPSNGANSALYVQNSGLDINGMGCGAAVNQEGYFWWAEWVQGNPYYVTDFHTVYYEPGLPNASMTRECTIVTNGQNLLQFYFGTQLVYSSDTLNLNMKSPFFAFLEEQTSYSGGLLYGVYQDYYAASSDTVKVTGLHLGDVAELVSPNGTVLASSQVGTSGDALISVGGYHMPISGSIKVYDLKHKLLAQTAPTGIWGGDVYGSSGAQPSQLTIKSQTTDGTPITGMYTVLMQNGAVKTTGFTPATFNLTSSAQYTVEVQDYGSLVFDHWLDSGSTVQDRTISIQSDTQLTAVYRNTSAPPSSGHSLINVTTVNSQGVPITGYYTTLWQNGNQLQSCFSPCGFSVNNGQTYSVAVADYNGVLFNHWSDGSTTRLYTVPVGNNSTTINLIAYYTP